jgi:hypothetical protein
MYIWFTFVGLIELPIGNFFAFQSFVGRWQNSLSNKDSGKGYLSL